MGPATKTSKACKLGLRPVAHFLRDPSHLLRKDQKLN